MTQITSYPDLILSVADMSPSRGRSGFEIMTQTKQQSCNSSELRLSQSSSKQGSEIAEPQEANKSFPSLTQMGMDSTVSQPIHLERRANSLAYDLEPSGPVLVPLDKSKTVK